MKKKRQIEQSPKAPDHLLLFLFISFFRTALFIVGGGLVMLPMIERIFVREKKLLTHADMLDMLAVMQTMPGMMAVNAAIFVGHKLAGLKGAVVSVIGVILPSILIMIMIAALFMNLDIQNPHILRAFSCVRACVAAIFVGMAFHLGPSVLKQRLDYVIVGGFIIALLCHVSQVILILISIPVGWGYVLYRRWRAREK